MVGGLIGWLNDCLDSYMKELIFLMYKYYFGWLV